jgi:phosphoglycerol geranylgeranyltransferase
MARDGSPPWRGWTHITKLDPDRPIAPEAVKAVAESGTSAVMVSGTQNVTSKKIARLVEMLRPYDLPKVLEPVDGSMVTYDPFDHVFVPTVLNSGNPAFIVGKHAAWLKRGEIRWERVVPEAYLVLNPDSAVGRLTQAKPLDAETAAAYAAAAEGYFNFPVVYIECSGTFGSPEVVEAVKRRLKGAALFYGGGIDSAEKAKAMKRWADAVVVGNVLYEKGLDAYLETVV